MIPAVLAAFEAAVEKRINGCPFGRMTDFEIATDAGISMNSVWRAKRSTKRFTVTSNGREPTVYREAEVAPISPNETKPPRLGPQIGPPDRGPRQGVKRSQPIDSLRERVLPLFSCTEPLSVEAKASTGADKPRGRKPSKASKPKDPWKEERVEQLCHAVPGYSEGRRYSLLGCMLRASGQDRPTIDAVFDKLLRISFAEGNAHARIIGLVDAEVKRRSEPPGVSGGSRLVTEPFVSDGVMV
jgi:hypothetical protein